MSSKQNQIVAGGMIIVLFILILLNAKYRIFGDEFGKAVFAFSTVTMVYFTSSLVSKLAMSAKLKKYKITHPQLNPKMTSSRIALTLGISLMFGAMVGTVGYLTPETVEYSDFNYALMTVLIAMVPVATVIRSWFDY